MPRRQPATVVQAPQTTCSGPSTTSWSSSPSTANPTVPCWRNCYDLVQRGLIRVLDLTFVQRGADGSVAAVSIEDLGLAGEVDTALFADASSGLLDDADLADAGGVLQPGHSAAVLVYENRWAASFAAALRRTGADLVATGRIPVQAILATLDDLEPADR